MSGKEFHRSKRIRTKCSIQLMSGHILNGTTRTVSIDGAFIECQPLSSLNKTPPKTGDSALLTVYIKSDNEQATIKSRCRLNTVYPDGVDVGAQFAYMGKAELELFENFLKSSGA